MAMIGAPVAANVSAGQGGDQAKTIEVHFTSYDGHEMFGKLTLPNSPGTHPVVVYVQTAEGMTVDVKRQLTSSRTYNYFDLYRAKLPEMNLAFFSYEGRGIRVGVSPPRYETIDRDIYNTSTIENKVRDAMSAVQAIRKQPGINPSMVYLMGASEGTLLAAEAACRMPRQIKGLILYGILAVNLRDSFRFIVTDGTFLIWRQFFDIDNDGRISKQEFAADPRKFRERLLKNAPFENYDKDGDGFLTKEEFRMLPNPLRDAVEQNNYEVLDQWARTNAGVTTPRGWFKDRFAHPTIWTFFSQLNIPVGLFQGSADTNTSIEAVRELEAKARSAGKVKMEFHYFDGLDHSLNIIEYFAKGTLPAGHQAIFEFIRKLTANERSRREGKSIHLRASAKDSRISYRSCARSKPFQADCRLSGAIGGWTPVARTTD